MQARRRLLMMPHGLDTSPIILQYDKRYDRGNVIDSNGYCITKIYDYAPQSQTQYIETNEVYFQIMIYKDGVYLDYWSSGNYKLNVNSNGLAVTISAPYIDDSYLYIKGTGEILFAGKNTIYYGHRNISELN